MIQSLLTKLNKYFLYQIIFYKYFYKFIFLHKPLCPRYKDSTIILFGLYICRSCLLLYSGFLISMVLLLKMLYKVNFDIYLGLLFFGFILILILSYPPIYSKFNRLVKDFIRFFDGVFLAAMFVICFKINIFTGFLSLFVFWIIKYSYNKKRSGERICKDCKDLVDGTTCVGYKLQKETLLKIEEEYSNIRMKGEMNL